MALTGAEREMRRREKKANKGLKLLTRYVPENMHEYLGDLLDNETEKYLMGKDKGID